MRTRAYLSKQSRQCYSVHVPLFSQSLCLKTLMRTSSLASVVVLSDSSAYSGHHEHAILDLEINKSLEARSGLCAK